MKNYIIFGDTSFAERLAKYILFEKQDNIVCFTQEDAFCSRDTILGFPVIPLNKLRENVKVDFEILIAIGYAKMNNLRRQLYNILINAGFKIGTWISNKAIVYSDKIGEGTIVLPGVVIGPDCQIGKCNFFESSVVLSHDNQIGDFNFFSTKSVLGGSASVGNHCFLGLHSTIKNGIEIADLTLIGAGANVLTMTESGGVYVGNPAKKLLHKSIETKI